MRFKAFSNMGNASVEIINVNSPQEALAEAIKIFSADCCYEYPVSVARIVPHHEGFDDLDWSQSATEGE